MSLVKVQDIKYIFGLFNNNIEYILLRNIDNKIPNRLELMSDIDILVNKSDTNKLSKLLTESGYYENNSHCSSDIYLYGVDKYRQFIKNDVLLDIQFQLMARSLDAGQWIPLDQIIQESAWKNKRLEQRGNNFVYWTLGYDDEFICLVVRSIFDKKEFQNGYKKNINKLFLMIDKDEVIKKLNMVFFKFTPYLMDMIERQDYDKVIINYLQFKEY